MTPPLHSIVCWVSEPPADFRFVFGVLGAEAFGERDFFGCDLEAANVEHKGQRPWQRQRCCQECCPGDQDEQKPNIHGISCDSIYTRTHERTCRLRLHWIDRCSCASEG